MNVSLVIPACEIRGIGGLEASIHLLEISLCGLKECFFLYAHYYCIQSIYSYIAIHNFGLYSLLSTSIFNTWQWGQ